MALSNSGGLQFIFNGVSIMTRFGLTTVASVLRGIAAQTTSRRC
jgi:hypothetical protein